MEKKFHRSAALDGILSIGFVLLLVAVLLLTILLPKREFSEEENRYLAEWPEFSRESLLDGSYFEDVADWLSDHIVLRDFWVTCDAGIKRILGQKENGDIYFAGDNTLIAKVEEPGEQYLKNIDSVSQLAEKAGVPVFFGLIPSAADIWQEKLPAGAPTAEEESAIAAGYEKFSTQGTAIDIRSSLWEHREEAIYYRTDHHWTTLGAYYGAKAIAEAMGWSLPEKESYQRETVSESFYGTSRSFSGAYWVEPDSIERWVEDTGIEVISNFSGKDEPGDLYQEEALEKKNQYTYFMGGNQPLAVIKNPNARSDKKLLLIRDSYSDTLAPFLAEEYSEVHLFDLRYNKLKISEYIPDKEIDEVLVLYSFSSFEDDRNVFMVKR